MAFLIPIHREDDAGSLRCSGDMAAMRVNADRECLEFRLNGETHRVEDHLNSAGDDVALQSSTPGTAQTGHVNVSGTVKGGTVEDSVGTLAAVRAGGVSVASQAAYDLLYASSASQLARIANGTTGHVLRATTSGAPVWQSKGWFDVRDYGAVGNGTTDDTTAIQATIAAAEAADGGVVLFPPGTYKVTAALRVAHDFVHLAGLTPGQGTSIVGYGAINVCEVGNGTDWINYGSVSNLRFRAGDASVLRSLYLRSAHNYDFRNASANGGTIACVEIVASYIQRWYGGEMAGSNGHGIYINDGGNTANRSNALNFYGTRLWANTGTGLYDTGGQTRHFDLICETNGGGGLYVKQLRGFVVQGGYYETNTGFDVKVDTSCVGGTLGGYFMNGQEANHKFIHLVSCAQIDVGSGSMLSENATTGHVGVYVESTAQDVSIAPIAFTMVGGSSGTVVSGTGASTASVVLDRTSPATGRVRESGTHITANGAVNFASTGTWRTVAVIEFASTDYGGGYLVCGFGGIQATVGGAQATLTGTMLKSSSGNPAFTEITNAATNCLIQATNDGATKIVVQMKSSATTNLLTGQFSVMVLGSAYTSFAVTAPGYSD